MLFGFNMEYVCARCGCCSRERTLNLNLEHFNCKQNGPDVCRKQTSTSAYTQSHEFRLEVWATLAITNGNERTRKCCVRDQSNAGAQHWAANSEIPWDLSSERDCSDVPVDIRRTRWDRGNSKIIMENPLRKLLIVADRKCTNLIDWCTNLLQLLSSFDWPKRPTTQSIETSMKNPSLRYSVIQDRNFVSFTVLQLHRKKYMNTQQIRWNSGKFAR